MIQTININIIIIVVISIWFEIWIETVRQSTRKSLSISKHKAYNSSGGSTTFSKSTQYTAIKEVSGKPAAAATKSTPETNRPDVCNLEFLFFFVYVWMVKFMCLFTITVYNPIFFFRHHFFTFCEWGGGKICIFIFFEINLQNILANKLPVNLKLYYKMLWEHKRKELELSHWLLAHVRQFPRFNFSRHSFHSFKH